MKVTIKIDVENAKDSYWDDAKVEKEMSFDIDDDQTLMKVLRATQTMGAAVSTLAVAAVHERIVLRDAPPMIEGEG